MNVSGTELTRGMGGGAEPSSVTRIQGARYFPRFMVGLVVAPLWVAIEPWLSANVIERSGPSSISCLNIKSGTVLQDVRDSLLGGRAQSTVQRRKMSGPQE